MARVKRRKSLELKAFFDELREAEARFAAKSPYYMAKYVIGKHYFENGRTTGWNRHHEDLSRDLWATWQSRKTRPWGTIYRLEWPRGTRKSTLADTAFAICVILNDPNIRILIDSNNLENSRAFLYAIKSVFSSEYFIELYGDMRDMGDWSVDSMTVKRTATSLKESTIAVSSVDSEKTSKHYDLIISDDTQTEQNSRNREQITRVIDNFKLYASLMDPSALCVSIGTPWAFGDEGEYIQGVYEDDIKYGRNQRIFLNQRSCFKKMEDGRLDMTAPEFPELLDIQTLNFRRASQKALFAFNYMCVRQSDDDATFKKDWFQYHEKGLNDLVGANIYITIDPAGEGTYTSADYNAIMVTAIDSKCDWYVLHYERKHLNRMELFDLVADLCLKFNPKKVGIEKVFKQHELAAWLKQRSKMKAVYIPWADFKTSHQTKAHRISALQTYYASKKVFIRRDMLELEDELLQYPRSAHDDLIDALAYTNEFIAVPREQQDKEWWNRSDWKETFEPTAEFPEMPSERNVRMWKFQERAKKRLHQRQRFIPLSRAI